jgi:uncharacterized repeat protein (TIGR01451 family)
MYAMNTLTELATGLHYPEGVTVGADGLIYITESDLESLVGSNNPADFQNARAYVSSVAPTAPYTYTRLHTASPNISGAPPTFVGSFDSFSGITQGEDGLLYVGNEMSGVETSQMAGGFTFIFTSTRSVFTVDPQTSDFALFASDLTTVEGLHFNAESTFPLYVAEEDTSGAANNQTGRVSRVNDDGSHTPFCTGFFDIEDVLVAADGTIYVSEDTSGLVIALNLQTATPESDLTVSKTADVTSTVPGMTITYTIEVGNTGADTATNVVVSDVVDSLLNVINVSSSVAVNQTGTAPSYVWELPDLGASESAFITVTAVISNTIMDSTTIGNTVTVSAANDANMANNSSTANIVVNVIKLFLPVIMAP